MKQVGRELGVRYVLEGWVRKGGNRVRITAQLIEAETGAHLWADRFDGSLEDVFDLQDKVAINVAGVIEPALQAAEVGRSAARPTHDLTAYDLYLRALAIYSPITKERLLKALELLQQAIAIDRYCGPALSLAAMCQMRLFREGWAEEPENASEAIDLARQSLQVAGDDPGILANAAFVLANFGEDIGAMMALVDRALALTPSFSRGWFLAGVLRLWAGQHHLAIEHAETALRLSPRERTGTPLRLIGEAHFFKREFDEAASKLLLSVQENPGYPHSLPRSRRVLCSLGTARRSARGDCEAAQHYASPGAERLTAAEPCGPRAVSVGPLRGGGRTGMIMDFARIPDVCALNLSRGKNGPEEYSGRHRSQH